MRRIIALLLCVSMIFMMGGCGDKSDESASSGNETYGNFGSSNDGDTEAESGKTAGSFAMPYNSSYGWDPYNCIGMENQAVMELVYEGLFTLNSSFEAENVLCESYTVDDTGLIYTLTLREAQFSNGNSLTAKDVVYSFNQAKNSTLYSSRFSDIESYKANGDSTLVITLSNQNSLLTTLLDFPIIANKSKNSPVGTGPFVLSGTSLTKNSNWWNDASSISFNVVSLYESTSAEETRDSFEIDSIHLLYNNPSAASAASFHCDFELWTSASTTMEYLGFNTALGIFEDAQVRAAVVKAIDRDTIAAAAYGGYAVASPLPVNPASPMYDETLAADFDYNPSGAFDELLSSGSFYLPTDVSNTLKRKMTTAGTSTDDSEDDTEADDEAEGTEGTEDDTDTQADTQEDTTDDDTETQAGTYTDGEDAAADGYNSIVFVVENGSTKRLEAAEIIKENLEAVGFTVEMDLIDQDYFKSTLQAATYDIYLGEVALRPDFDLRELIEGTGTVNYSFIYGDADLYSLIDLALENSGNYYDLYQDILNNGYICPILFENNAVFTIRGVFSGLNPSPDNVFYDIKNITVN